VLFPASSAKILTMKKGSATMNATYICTHIDYDTAYGAEQVSKKLRLPQEITVFLDEVIEDEDLLEEILGDAISNETGWAVNGFQYELAYIAD
jgi:hypothetical protein